ncbi:MAG: phosphatase PAP2 family protein [Nocardioides sp.]
MIDRSWRPRLLPSVDVPPAADDEEPARPWLLSLWLVTVVFVAIGVWRSEVVGIWFRDPKGNLLRDKFLATLMLLVVLIVVDALWRGLRTPGLGVLSALRRRWTWRRVGLTLVALVGYHLIYFTYRNLKSWDVFNAPRDRDLTALDQWLFFGHSPAVLLHDLLGQGLADHILVPWYESFATMNSIALLAFVAFNSRLRDGMVAVAALAWAWILGVGSYYLVPSLGPFQDRPQDFAGLPRSIVTQTQALYMDQRATLLAHPSAHDSFAQISAFASLHIGITALILMMLRYHRLRGLSYVMGVYLLGTIVATIYLGWHFAVDDVAGLLIAWASVWLGQLTIYWRGARTGSRSDRPAETYVAG